MNRIRGRTSTPTPHTTLHIPPHTNTTHHTTHPTPRPQPTAHTHTPHLAHSPSYPRAHAPPAISHLAPHLPRSRHFSYSSQGSYLSLGATNKPAQREHRPWAVGRYPPNSGARRTSMEAIGGNQLADAHRTAPPARPRTHHPSHLSDAPHTPLTHIGLPPFIAVLTSHPS